MNRIMRVVGVLPCLLILDAGAQGNDDLAIQLHALRRTVTLGTPLELNLEFINVSHTPFQLSRTNDFGPDAIDVVARRDGCEYRVHPLHWDIIDSSDRFTMLTRLFGGDRLWQELTLNNPDVIDGQLSLPGPGAYMVRATFRSEGRSVQGSRETIWRGFVQSPEVRIVFESPDLVALERRRAALRPALQGGGEMDIAALRYFQLVKDEVAGDLLVQLLDKAPDHTVLLDAIAHQNRRTDAVALDRAAERSSYRLFKEYTIKLANRLRNPDSCD